jgi:hypothetical protein
VQTLNTFFAEIIFVRPYKIKDKVA